MCKQEWATGICSGRRSATKWLAIALVGALCSACQVTPGVSVKKLEEHRESSDLSGLQPAKPVDTLGVSWAIPGNWSLLPAKKHPLYTHQQWRSPTMATGVGVAHIQMPFALPASTILWFAKNEYLKRAAKDSKDGQLIAQWTDSLGRQWFEAENNKYHVLGYVMSRGSEAWVAYSGYRVTVEARPLEIELAERSLESVVPLD
jgi:hypothetical protein